MSEHFRNFADPEIDTYASAILEPEDDLVHRTLVRQSERLLTSIGGTRLEDDAEGQRWAFANEVGHAAVMRIYEPETVIPALFRYRDTGLFYTYVNGLWTPDTTRTWIAPDVDSGNPEADGLVMLSTALEQAVRLPRRLGWAPATLAAPLRDRKAIATWRPSTERTKSEIAAHYDLSPDVYTGDYGFLDSRFVQYSSGLLAPGRKFESLEDLQEQKVEALGKKLALDTAETLLEVGGGWGGLAIALAQRYPNLHITSLTVSDEQLKIAQQKAREAGVADRVTFLGQDYRDHQPEKPYDRVVSVEMLEAVDWRDHDTYFDALSKFADKKHGVIVLQTINIHPKQFAAQRHVRSFANTAIFPGGILTPKEVISRKMQDRRWFTHEVTELGPSYALTLREWIRNLENHRPALTQKWLAEGQSQQDIDRFYRGFELYLAFSEAGFRRQMNNIQDSQITFCPIG